MNNRYKLPEGLQDRLPEECYFKNIVEEALMRCFTLHGFNKVETPSFEYFEHFRNGTGAVSAAQLFKFTDTDGNLLALRPDMTLPIARVVATKLGGTFAEKLCYLANSYTLQTGGNRDREFTQAGVEVIGGKNQNPEGTDAEIIALAVEALLKTGLDDFIIDIGHIGFVREILDRLGLADEQEAELLSAINKKNMLAIDLFAKRNGLYGNKYIDAVLKLPSLFGGAEVLDEAEKLPAGKKAISGLRKIYQNLKAFGYEKYISFDLSFVNGAGYYTGVVFSGMTKFFGAPVVGGGRYDSLCEKDGEFLPGAGFAIGIRRLSEALKRLGRSHVLPVPRCAVGCVPARTAEAHEFAKKLREQGKAVDNTYIGDEAGLKAYAKERGIPETKFFGGEGK